MNKATLVAILMLAVLAAGAMLVNRSLRSATERPAVQRLASQARLKEFAAALQAYRDHHQAWPDGLGQLLKDAHLGIMAPAVRGAGVYRYRRPPADAPPDYVVMWSDTNHAGIARGEPWGAAGEVAKDDVPPIAYVLTAGGEVDGLDEAAFKRRAPAPTAP